MSEQVIAPSDMSEPVITYSAVKFDPSKSQEHGNKVREKEMVAYSELKFQNQAEQQTGRRFQQADGRDPEGSPSPSRRNKDTSAPSVRRQPTSLILGILCLVLLMATGVLGYLVLVTELSCEKGNVTQLLMSCPSQTPCLPGTPEEQPRDAGEKCPARWVVHKDSSYLFSPEKGTWEKCHSSCISQSAQLLTTEGGEELDFIKKESFHYFEDHDGVTQYHTFWIGLSYDPGSRKWVWADDSDLSSGLFDLQDLSHQNDQDRVCAYIEGGRAKAGGICRETHFCICEKRRKEPVGTH